MRAEAQLTNWGALLATALLIVYGLYFVFDGRLVSADTMEQTTLIPPDSIRYVEAADEVSADGVTPIEFATGALNWLGVSLVFSYFQELGGYGPLAFILINGACLYIWLDGSATLMRLREPFRSLAPILSTLASPFLLGWMLAPNKELPTAALLIMMFKQAQIGRSGRLLGLSILATLFKIQVLVGALLYTLGRRLRFRRSIAIIGLSIAIPILMPLVEGLSIENFLDSQDSKINSVALFRELDQINSWPFGFVLVAPFRVVINIFAGLVPMRVFTYTETADLIASLTSLSLGVVGLLSVVKAGTEREFRRQIRGTTDCGYLLTCVALAFSLVPFLQVRYYWWAIPLMISYLLRAPRCQKVEATLPSRIT